MTCKKTDVNWVKNLPQYMKCCNYEKREELSWKSTFEIYYGRKQNELLNDWKSHDSNIHFSNTVGPSERDFENQQNFARQWRKTAMKADERMRKRMLRKKDASKNAYKLYKLGGKVFIRLLGEGKDSLKKHRVLVGRILKRLRMMQHCLVKVKILEETKLPVQKVKIENIDDNSRLPKQNQSNKQKEKTTKILRIPLTRIDCIEGFTKQG